MKTIYYHQCLLRKTLSDGSWLEQTSYIPKKFVTSPYMLKLKNNDGEWVNDWKIISFCEIPVKEEDLPDSYQDIKNHRKQTGDYSMDGDSF